MNNEVEAYVGELRQLREREVKLGRIVHLIECLAEHGVENEPGITEEDCHAFDQLKRAAAAPDIQNWLDKLRQEGKVDVKRYPTPAPSRQQGEEQNVA